MQTIKFETRTVEECVHNFYCDGCNKYLGSSEECDDGYYNKLGEFHLHFFIKDSWYGVDKIFCDKCKEKFIEKVTTALTDLGFDK